MTKLNLLAWDLGSLNLFKLSRFCSHLYISDWWVLPTTLLSDVTSEECPDFPPLSAIAFAMVDNNNCLSYQRKYYNIFFNKGLVKTKIRRILAPGNEFDRAPGFFKLFA